jgi:hypothetical protein
MADRALVLHVGPVPGYGPGHVTVAYVKTDTRLSLADVQWVKAQVRASEEGAEDLVWPDESASSVEFEALKAAAASAAAGAGADAAALTSGGRGAAGLDAVVAADGLRERLAILKPPTLS